MGVVTSVGVSAVFGFFVLLSLLFSIQNFQNTVGSKYGQPVVQILVDVFGENGAIVLMTLIMICVWHCGLFSMTSNSRMMFAFSRDGALPHFFHKVDARWQSPIRTGDFPPPFPVLFPLTPHSLARGLSLLLPSSPLPRLGRRLLRRYLHRHNRALPLLRHPDPDRRHPPQILPQGALLARPGVAHRRPHWRAMDLFHQHHFLSAHRQPRHQPDVELYARRRWHHCCVCVWQLAAVGPSLVHGPNQAD